LITPKPREGTETRLPNTKSVGHFPTVDYPKTPRGAYALYQAASAAVNPLDSLWLTPPKNVALSESEEKLVTDKHL
jgi:hypothetical protein